MYVLDVVREAEFEDHVPTELALHAVVRMHRLEVVLKVGVAGGLHTARRASVHTVLTPYRLVQATHRTVVFRFNTHHPPAFNARGRVTTPVKDNSLCQYGARSRGGQGEGGSVHRQCN